MTRRSPPAPASCVRSVGNAASRSPTEPLGRWRNVNVFFFQAEDGIRDYKVTGVQTVCSSDLIPRDKITRAAMLANSTPSKRTNPADRKSTRLNSSHLVISYAVFCLKKKF